MTPVTEAVGLLVTAVFGKTRPPAWTDSQPAVGWIHHQAVSPHKLYSQNGHGNIS